MSYLYTYLQSNLLELPIFAFGHWVTCAVLLQSPKNGRVLSCRSLWITTLCNAITHPIVFFGWLAKGTGLAWFSAIVGAEAFAIAAEVALHGYALNLSWAGTRDKLAWLTVGLTSAVANLWSWELGPILTWWTLLR